MLTIHSRPLRGLAAARTLLFLAVLSPLSVGAISPSPTSSASTSPAASPSAPPAFQQLLVDAISQSTSFDNPFDAQVWLVDMSHRLRRYMPNDEERLTFLRLVHQEASRVGISPELVLAVIHVESGFQRFAISSVGALGYMQIMPFWKHKIGHSSDNLMHMHTNLRYGCSILKIYLDRERGDWIRALARYNGSLGRTKYPERVLLYWEKYWFINYDQ